MFLLMLQCMCIHSLYGEVCQTPGPLISRVSDNSLAESADHFEPLSSKGDYYYYCFTALTLSFNFLAFIQPDK